jgi:large-conductance mechanosensitive channel
MIIDILTNFQIIGTMIGYTLGLVFYNIINSFMLSVVKPLLGPNKKYTLTLFGTKLFLGELFGAFIDFVLVIIIVFFLLRYVLRDIIKQIIQLQNMHDEKQTLLLEKILKEKDPYTI